MSTMDNWKPAPDRPGYRCKTVQRGPATITLYRPILTETEAAKAQEQVRTALEGAMRSYYGRKTREAAAS